MRTIILGAGITGLVAGYSTGYEVFEASYQAGGICHTYRKDGFMFENGGGHWIFGANEMVRNFLTSLDIDLKEYKKNSGVYFNTVINGSIQNHANRSCLLGMGSMKERLCEKFGKDLCEMFFFPFNERYTNGLYEVVEPQDEYKNPANGKSYNDTFLYPEQGLDSLINAMTDKCRIVFGRTATVIDPIKQIVYFDTGKTETYDQLISTIPLNHLLKMVGMEGYLPHTSTVVFNIGADKGRNFPKEQWLYVPYSRFYRIGFYSNVDAMFAPEGKCSLYVESSDTNLRPEEVMEELVSYGIIENPELLSWNVIPVSYTYQYPGTRIDKHLEALKELNIISTGRYGKWRFCGIAESIEMALGVR